MSSIGSVTGGTGLVRVVFDLDFDMAGAGVTVGGLAGGGGGAALTGGLGLNVLTASAT